MEPQPRRSAAGGLTIAFYVGVATLVLFSYWSRLQDLVPAALAPRISRNNEGYVFVLVAIIYLAFGHPDRAGSGAVRAFWFGAVVAAFAFTGFVAEAPQVPQTVVTLNEAFLGFLILASYLELSRHRETGHPIASRRAFFYALVAFIPLLGELPIRGWEGTAFQIWIVDHAEAWGFAIVSAVLVDFIRPWPTGVRPSRAISAVWYLALLATPVIVDWLNPHGVDSAAAIGPIESGLVWIQRITEAFVAVFLLTLWFDLRGLAKGRRDSVDRPHDVGVTIGNR